MRHHTLRQTALLCALLLLPATAGAQVAVLVEGGSGSTPRAIKNWVPRDIGLVSSSAFTDALRKQGVSGSIGASVVAGGARKELVAKAVAAGREVGAGLLILGKVGTSGATTVHLLIIDVAGSTVQFDDRVVIPLKKGKKRRRRRTVKPDFDKVKSTVKPLISRFGKTTARAEGYAAASGGGKNEEAWAADAWGAPDWASGASSSTGPSRSEALLTREDAGEEEDGRVVTKRRERRSGRDITSAGLLLSPGYVACGRFFAYEKATTANLRPYEAPFVSALGINVELYPVAFVGIEYARDVGLVATYKQALGLKSTPENDDETSLDTQWDELDAGVKYRMHAGPVLIGVALSYGWQRMLFTLPVDSPLAGQVPQVEYKYLRAGFDTRIGIDDIGVIIGGGYRYNLGTGTVGEDYFPTSSTLAFDATVGGGYLIMPVLEARALATYSRIKYTMNAGDGAAYVADGAVDQFFGIQLGLTLFL